MIRRLVERLGRGWAECVAALRDAHECGDWPGHLWALAGVLLGAIGEDSADWRPL